MEEIDACTIPSLGRGERRCLSVRASAIGARLGQTRVLVSAHVVPGPAVEAAFLDRGDVIGDQVIAEVVALIGRAPKSSGDGIDGLADAVADS